MAKEIVIDVHHDGKVEGMHFDQFDLGFLGKKRVERASDIVWDAMGEYWEIRVAQAQRETPQATQGFTTYESAREFEVAWFQECRKQGVSPDSEEGERIAIDLRGVNKAGKTPN